MANISAVTFVSFLSLYIRQELLGSYAIVGWAFSIAAITEVPCMVYLGALSDKIGRKPPTCCRSFFLPAQAIPLHNRESTLSDLTNSTFTRSDIRRIIRRLRSIRIGRSDRKSRNRIRLVQYRFFCWISNWISTCRDDRR